MSDDAYDQMPDRIVSATPRRRWRDRRRDRRAMHACRCGHVRATHDHYRPGHDCGSCHCPEFRRSKTGW